jgi:hypothetical protein
MLSIILLPHNQNHNKLDNIGMVVSGDDAILALLMGLDASYDSFILSLSSIPYTYIG